MDCIELRLIPAITPQILYQFVCPPDDLQEVAYTGCQALAPTIDCPTLNGFNVPMAPLSGFVAPIRKAWIAASMAGYIAGSYEKG